MKGSDKNRGYCCLLCVPLFLMQFRNKKNRNSKVANSHFHTQYFNSKKILVPCYLICTILKSATMMQTAHANKQHYQWVQILLTEINFQRNYGEVRTFHKRIHDNKEKCDAELRYKKYLKNMTKTNIKGA